MKRILFSLILLILLGNATYTQIDTTNWYPLQVGNKWQFTSSLGIFQTSYVTYEVTGDTVINNLKYYIIENEDRVYYQRLVDNSYVYEYNPDIQIEYIAYDFISNDKSIWTRDSLIGDYGVFETFESYFPIYTDTLVSKIYNDVYIDRRTTPPDTLWGAFVDGTAKVITKGIGITTFGSGINYEELIGVIIDGDTLGTVYSNKLLFEKDTLKFVNEIDSVNLCSIKNLGYEPVKIDSISQTTNWPYQKNIFDGNTIIDLPFELGVNETVNLKILQFFIIGEFFGEESHIIDTITVYTSYDYNKIKYEIITDMKVGVVSVNVDYNSSKSFSLSQNYPNPFNPTTAIEYSIPNVETLHATSVQLKIYNLLGQEVATLVNEKQPPGTYKATFDASGLPSGIYFYRLEAGSFSQTKKMVYLR